MQRFDAESELAKLKKEKEIRKKRVYTARKSKLYPVEFEVKELHKASASYTDIKIWLLTNKKIKVSRTTIMRFLKNAIL